MKKLLSLTLMALGLLAMTHRVEAANGNRTAKEVFVSSYTTGSVLITPTISTNAVSTAAFQPGALYEVLLSSGAASEYLVLVDTANCVGVTATIQAGGLTAPAKFATARLLFGSTTANTDNKFDPPIAFNNGLCIIDSASTGMAQITYELGRGVGAN